MRLRETGERFRPTVINVERPLQETARPSLEPICPALVANSLSPKTTRPVWHANLPTIALNGDKLRKEAEEARRMADAARNQQDRDFWLRIADGWMETALKAHPQAGKMP